MKREKTHCAPNARVCVWKIPFSRPNLTANMETLKQSTLQFIISSALVTQFSSFFIRSSTVFSARNRRTIPGILSFGHGRASKRRGGKMTKDYNIKGAFGANSSNDHRRGVNSSLSKWKNAETTAATAAADEHIDLLYRNECAGLNTDGNGGNKKTSWSKNNTNN